LPRPQAAYTNVMSGDQTLFWIFVGVQIAFAALLVVMHGAKQLSRNADLSGTIAPASGLNAN